MTIEAEVLADSLHPAGRDRLTTFRVRCPMGAWIHLLTHRAFSRNAASRRAVPARRQIDDVVAAPYVPVEWERNGKGMVAPGTLDDEAAGLCRDEWSRAAVNAQYHAEGLVSLGAHKAIVGDLLTPFAWVEGVVTSGLPGLENFWRLRCADDTRPHTRVLAVRMLAAWKASDPRRPGPDEWHLPFVADQGDEECFPDEDRLAISAARCARVSYRMHDTGMLSQPDADLALAARLAAEGHLSPFEHQARPWNPYDAIDGLRGAGRNLGPGWTQYRVVVEHRRPEAPAFDPAAILARYAADLEPAR